MVINLSYALDAQLQHDAQISHFEYQVSHPVRGRRAHHADERAGGPDVEEVRRLVFDPLTQAQRTLRAIGHRVNQAVDPSDTCPD
ncbi:hypothetical protein [Streptomyces sp. NPDC004050]